MCQSRLLPVRSDGRGGGLGMTFARMSLRRCRYSKATPVTIAAISTSRSQRVPRMLAPVYAGSMSERVRILATGGTFDKEYNELTGELFFQATHIGDMLRLGRCDLDVEIDTLMMIDSLQMTDAGRELILRRAIEVP